MTQVQAIKRCVNVLEAQRGHLFLWVPVCLGIGVGGYFSLRFEPDVSFWWALAAGIVFLGVLARWVSPVIAPLFVALALVGIGAGLAKWRVERVAGPVLEYRYYGPVEGRVIRIDRSASDAVRLLLDRVVLQDHFRSETPRRVRVSLHGEQPISNFQPGDVVILTGHLSPPSGPAEPGGFDFQRHAWFIKLGGVGYTRNPVLRAAYPIEQELVIARLRHRLSQSVQAAMPGETGAFAAAIMTGDRAAISPETLDNLRASNLAHLLAISGLHMGLLTGFVFALVRYGLALIPRIALYHPIKKWAAVIALAVGAFYLALSGGNVATVRAYIMVSVMLCAVLLDRRALSLRSVAIAATLVLILTPEALVGPGFQMSFAATTALVATYRAVKRLDLYRWPNWVQAVLNVILTSFVAGLATAPIAAAHFNQIAHYGLFANVLSVPLMGILVMPAAVLAVCLAPFGLWGVGLWIMDKGLRWILFVSDTAANQPGALSHVKAPDPHVLVILTLGLLFTLLWRGRLRFVGTPIAAAAFLIWGQADRADVLIADNGGLVGIMTDEGRALSKPRGSGFVAGIWLENDGAPVDQAKAAEREGFDLGERRMRTTLNGYDILQVSGKTALAALQGCDGADVLVSNQDDAGDRPCFVLDLKMLAASGAVALDRDGNGLRVTTARDLTGLRPWNQYGWNPEMEWPPRITQRPDRIAENQ